MHFRQLAEDHDLAVVTQLELRQSKMDLRYQINQVLTPYLKIIDEIVLEGIDQDIFKEDLHITLVRQMIFVTLDETVTTWVMKEHRLDLLEKAEYVYE